MSSISIENNTYFYNKLREYPISNLSEFTRQTLTFCFDWLSGKNTFELKTSGSTSKPKKITLTRQQIKTSAQQTNTFLQLNSNDHYLVCVSTQMVAGLMMLVRAMEANATLTVIEPTGNPMAQLIKEYDMTLANSCNFTAMVPLQIKNIIIKGNQDELRLLNKMKAVLVGGGPIDFTLENEIKQLVCPVYHTYGMTETVSHVALKKLNGTNVSAYFKILPRVSIKQNEKGCLMIKSPVTQDKWLTTNDRVQLIDQKHFKWLGRIDFVINSGGIKMQAEEIEKKISTYFAENNQKRLFFISGLPDKKLGEKVCLYLEGDDIDIDKLKTALSKFLNKYEVPKVIYTQPEFYLTASGKIDRNKIILACLH